MSIEKYSPEREPAETLEDILAGKRAEEEKGDIEKLKTEHGRKLAQKELIEEIGKLNIGAGDKIISTTGTVREVIGFNFAGLFFDVKTKRRGKPTNVERLTFQELMDGLGRGAIAEIKHVEEER